MVAPVLPPDPCLLLEADGVRTVIEAAFEVGRKMTDNLFPGPASVLQALEIDVLDGDLSELIQFGRVMSRRGHLGTAFRGLRVELLTISLARTACNDTTQKAMETEQEAYCGRLRDNLYLFGTRGHTPSG